MRTRQGLAIASLLCACGAAVGQVTVDGQLDASYGAAQWVNTLNPTGFGDNVVGSPGNPVAVQTGIEWRIPLAAIGNPAPGTQIKVVLFVNGLQHDFASDQWLPPLPPTSPNLGEPRNINLANLAGDQFALVPVPAACGDAPPAIDGTRDSFYGAEIAVQNQPTSFGNAGNGDPAVANGGSELDALYARVCGGYLYVLATGNLESNFNKLEMFVDSVAGGQNRLLGTNPVVDVSGPNPNGGLNRMGDSNGTNGLTFDAGFGADYWFMITNGGAPNRTFVNYARLDTTGVAPGNGFGIYLGRGTGGTWPDPEEEQPDYTSCGTGTPAEQCVAQDVQWGINNSNTAGVSGSSALTAASADRAVGSELDNFYATVCGTGADARLHLFFGGNLESNANKFEVFLDVSAGGQNRLFPVVSGVPNPNQDIDFNGLNRMGGPSDQIIQPELPADDPICVGNPSDPRCNPTVVTQPGLTFDAGFAADYWISFNNTNNGTEIYAAAAHLRTDGPARGFVLESLDYGSVDGGLKTAENPIQFDGDFCVRTETLPGPDGQPGTADDVTQCVAALCGGTSTTDVQGEFLLGEPTLAEIRSSFAPRLISANPYDPTGSCGGTSLAVPGLITATINNSNLAGVTGDAAAGAASVTTGIELSIDLDEAGWDGTSPIRVVAFINGGSHDFISNQVLGGLPAGTGNLAEPRTVNFDDTTGGIAGQQFIVVNPGTCGAAPSTGACCTVGAGNRPTCSVLSAADCATAGGSFRGAGTACQGGAGNPITCCPGNFNRVNGVTVQDIYDFLSDWNSQVNGGPILLFSADINGAGGVTVQDIYDFLSAWNLGCNG